VVNMISGLTRKRAVVALAFTMLLGAAFALGFVSCLHLKSATSDDLRRNYLLQKGDASPWVRSAVLTTLRTFQEGYTRRDPQQLDSFMRRVFPKSNEILLLGTDATEWVRGYREVGRFIRSDWQGWGDFSFAVDDSIVWSSGDVAWIASVGMVRGQGSSRPLRFSAILTRYDNRWLLRQVCFQWDDREPTLSDLLRLSTPLKLMNLLLRHIADFAAS
jgi:hypothetical protein